MILLYLQCLDSQLLLERIQLQLISVLNPISYIDFQSLPVLF